MRRAIVFLVAFIGMAAAGATLLRSAAPVDVPTATVERGTFTDFLPLRGEVRPERSIVITAPSSGGDMQIIELVANGAPIKAGDIVAVFDSTTHQRTREQKTSELRQAESELEKARAEERRRVLAATSDLEQARSSAARLRLDLSAAELLSKVDAEKRAIAVANAERLVAELEIRVDGEREAAAADVTIAEQKMAKVRFDLEDSERIINALSLRSPVDGMVSLLPNFRAGGPMSRTAPEFRRGDRGWAGAPIAELPDLSSVQMSLRVDEADRARLQSGAAARVRIDALPDRELNGRIHEISLVAKPDFSSFPPVRNFDVVVALTDTDERIRSGMSASARLELERVDDALLVPATSVFERDGQPVVFVVTGRGVETRPITIAKRGREQIVVASGLQPGDRIALQDPETTGGQR